MLAGNLGSDFRFDYSAIGDTTNVASRLEGLNKQLGTDIIISDATRQQLDNAVQNRCLGRFLLVGKTQPVTLYEVLGVKAEALPPWVAPFDDALQNFTGRAFDKAEELFKRVLELRGGHDGPSEFYLAQITKARQTLQPAEPWNGVVVLAEK